MSIALIFIFFIIAAAEALLFKHFPGRYLLFGIPLRKSFIPVSKSYTKSKLFLDISYNEGGYVFADADESVIVRNKMIYTGFLFPLLMPLNAVLIKAEFTELDKGYSVNAALSPNAIIFPASMILLFFLTFDIYGKIITITLFSMAIAVLVYRISVMRKMISNNLFKAQ
jgi:hypothetical protein